MRGVPGQRFHMRFRHARRAGQGPTKRWTMLVLGLALVIVGAVMLVAPGPGVLVLVLGASLLARQSLRVARWLDTFEVKLRVWVHSLSRHWHSTSLPMRSMFALAILAIAAASMAGVWAMWGT